MNYIEAINKLIQRNKNLVQKSGISPYTKETDEIINAILDQFKIYSRDNKGLFNAFSIVSLNREVCFELFGIPDEFKTIDHDFLQRYIEFDLVPQMWLSVGGTPETFELSEQSIIRQYKHYNKQIETYFELYLICKPHLLVYPETYKRLFPQFYNYAKFNYTDEQVKAEIKRTLYYNYE